MPRDWQELTKQTGSAPIVVERVRLVEKDIRIEGEFELPPLARLPAEDQVFVMAFLRYDGSIKEMERIFGISYPTVKNRLSRISRQFEFVDNAPPTRMPRERTPEEREEILKRLEQGEITAAEAIERLEK
jgi:hypothetical protein